MSNVTPTHQKILSHGLNLISQSGLAGLTVGSLAERTSMSKSGLFAHFGSRDQMQLALLDYTAQFAGEHVVAPAMRAADGLPRLRKLVEGWLGWTERAGLAGGCPVAAGLFELDDVDTVVRERLFAMEQRWRALLAQVTRQAVALGHLRPDLDVEQFVWELCGIYLSHHASYRFVRDPLANQRAQTAFHSLLRRASMEQIPT